MKRFRIVAVVALLTGCAGIIGVPDLDFDGNAAQGSGNADGSANADGGGTGPGSDGGGTLPDGAPIPPCDTSKLATDPNHCGACNHGCGGGDCAAGKCQPLMMGTITNAPMENLAISASYVFASSNTSLTTQKGGIWRWPINGGTVEQYSTLQGAETMVVVGDTLYFAVYDDPADDAGATGGLYSCPVGGPAPCTPTLLAPAQNAWGVNIDQGKVYFNDDVDGHGFMQLTPGTPGATVFRKDYNAPSFFVDKEDMYFTFTYFSDPQQAQLQHLTKLTDGGLSSVTTDFYSSGSANDGWVVGTTDSVFYTAFDYQDTTGGVVRRLSRSGGAGVCEYGGQGNLRPYGIALDATNIYWANQGEQDANHSNGSIATCPIAGCCTAAQVVKLWTGNGAPAGVKVDNLAVYWTVRDTGSVWKLAK